MPWPANTELLLVHSMLISRKLQLHYFCPVYDSTAAELAKFKFKIESNPNPKPNPNPNNDEV